MAISKFFSARDWLAGFLATTSNGGAFVQAVVQTDSSGNEVAGDYPANSTALIAGSGNAPNAVAAATLTPDADNTAYISGFEVTGAGATSAAVVLVTVEGLLGGTRSYTYGAKAGAAEINTPLVVTFDPPLPASAVNTAITVSCPALGLGNTHNTVVAHGYKR